MRTAYTVIASLEPTVTCNRTMSFWLNHWHKILFYSIPFKASNVESYPMNKSRLEYIYQSMSAKCLCLKTSCKGDLISSLYLVNFLSKKIIAVILLHHKNNVKSFYEIFISMHLNIGLIYHWNSHMGRCFPLCAIHTTIRITESEL